MCALPPALIGMAPCICMDRGIGMPGGGGGPPPVPDIDNIGIYRMGGRAYIEGCCLDIKRLGRMVACAIVMPRGWPGGRGVRARGMEGLLVAEEGGGGGCVG